MVVRNFGYVLFASESKLAVIIVVLSHGYINTMKDVNNGIRTEIKSLFELLLLKEGKFEQLVETFIKLDDILPQHRMFSGSLLPFHGLLTCLFNKYVPICWLLIYGIQKNEEMV